MTAHVFQILMRHLDLLDSIKRETYTILFSVEEFLIESIPMHSENRNRMTNILQKFQQEVYDCHKQSSGFRENPILLDIFKTWNLDVAYSIKQIEEVDEEISKLLQIEKNKASEEIAKNHMNKEKISGYNLSNVKK